MKICFLSSYHPPTDKRVFLKEAVTLVKEGFDVVHVAPGIGLSRVETGVLLYLYPLVKGLWGRVFNLNKLYRIAKLINADVYHCNEVDSWLIGIIIKMVYHKTVVFDVHEHYPSMLGYNRLPKFLQPISSAFVRFLYFILTPYTDQFVFAKESIIHDFHNINDRYITALNFTQLSLITNGSPEISEEIKNLFDGKFTAIHIGLFSKSRGWPQLLKAMAILEITNFQFISIGNINDGSEIEFWEMAKRFKLTNKIKLLNWMSFEEVYKYMLLSQVGLILFQPDDLNNVYAFPHKMFDYMLAKLPIIIPDFAVEVAPIVRSSNCGYTINTSNYLELSHALNSLSKDNSLRKKMGKNGFCAVNNKYNWENESVKLINMYKQLVINRVSIK
ncbi:MAG: glycosyltransferase [Bacteroidetes bacterium]|nr:glycosyltransferase [Bacteroidota bacterium]